MATPSSYLKIGLFVILGFAGAAALAVAVGVTRLHKRTITYYTYFNEPVTGLDVGAPVKARGVNVGQVGDIAFAPDRRTIEVRMDLETRVLGRFGGTHGVLDPGLRVQLASQGLTGSRFVSADFFDPTTNPPPALTFTAHAPYIPATKSQEKTLLDSATKAMDGLASLVDTLSREGLSEKTVQAMTSANDALTDIDHLMRSIDGQRIPQRAGATIEDFRVAVNKVTLALDRIGGDTGLIATAQRSVSSFGDVGRNATGATRDLDEALGEIREAAAAIRRLADEIERDPDSLLKGRAKAGTP